MTPSKQTKQPTMLAALLVLLLVGLTSGQHQFGGDTNQLDLWQTERPADMAQIKDLEVMCGKQHMEVQLTFDRPFNGIVFSKGAVDRYDCIYVKPQTGQSQYRFDILYNACGSKPDLNGRFYENNIVIQYDQDLIEVWDEAKRLRCEWYNDYEKGVTKPPIRVSDLEVVELNFRGDNVDCWMEIQQGKGPWASPVTGIVPLGTTLTMVVGIDDRQGEFDMRVKSCQASDNVNRPIELSDENGCVLRPKMISKFMKMRSTDSRATVVTYAFFHAFKFPDTMAVHIRCKVEICRFGCPDHCQNPGSYVAREQEVVSSINNYQAAGSAPQKQYAKPPQPAPAPQSSANPYQVYQQLRPQRKAQQVPKVRIPAGPVRREGGQGSSQPVQARRPQAPQARVQPNVPISRSHIDAQPELERSGGKFAPPLPQALRYRGPPERPSRPVHRHPHKQAYPNRRIDENKVEGGGLNFLGIKLPELDLPKLPELPELPKLSLPFFGGDDDETTDKKRDSQKQIGVKSEAIPVPLGRTPPIDALSTDASYERPSAVPVSRTASQGQPLVFPSSFNTASQNPVVPIEELAGGIGGFPYGPRSLNVESLEPPPKMMDSEPISQHRSHRRKRTVHSRNARSAELGVTSGYEVVSEVDLAFNPNEEGESIAVLKGRIQGDDEIVYGICLPATSFSALFVLLSLLTVVSIIVSGFVCYQRQLQKVAEEAAPSPERQAPVSVMQQPGNTGVPPQQLELADPQQLGWGFNTWFRKTNGGRRGVAAVVY